MNRPLQPRYQVKIDGVDVTRHVEHGMSYEEQPDLITVLSFTLMNGLHCLERFKIGHRVQMWGGNHAVGNYRKLFDGNLKKLSTQFEDNGKVKVALICYDTVWGQAASENNHFLYPSKTSRRGWASATRIRASEIVRNLIEREMQLEIGEIHIANDKEYTWSRPVDQKNISDWAMLRKLAKLLGCFVWAENTGDTQRVHFVDVGRAVSLAAKLEFVYVLRDDEGNYYTKELHPGQIPIRGVSVEEDSQQAFANKRIVTKFDPVTGNETQLISRYDEAKRTVYYYELDEAKVAQLRKDDPDEADRLLNQGATGIAREDFLKFYKETAHQDEEIAVFDTPFLGLTLSCTVDGNTEIRAQQSYLVRNIARYSSKERSGRYLLVGLTHTWDETGFISTLEFKR